MVLVQQVPQPILDFSLLNTLSRGSKGSGLLYTLTILQFCQNVVCIFMSAAL